jgi:hypothetical protein
MDLTDKLAAYIGISPDKVREWAIEAPKSYRMYSKPKKTGGVRQIYHPSKPTKALQYALLELVLNELPVHDVAMAYRQGLRNPLGSAAAMHKDMPYTVRVDFEDFFPSIRAVDLQPLLQQFGGLTDEDTGLLVRSTFIMKQGCWMLGIGAPSSPQISNAVMYEIDEACRTYAQGTNGVLCRYADDIIYSASTIEACHNFVTWLVDKLQSTTSPNLALKTEKTRFMSRANKRCVIGVVITPEGNLSIGRARKRETQTLIHKYRRYGLGDDEGKYLQGTLSFIHDVEPVFFNALHVKYGAEVLQRIKFHDWSNTEQHNAEC